MVWFRVDDGWHKHRKRIRAGLDIEGMAAQGLWAAAGSWASDELTDGFVPDDIVDYLAPGIGQQLAKRLERARLWVRTQRHDEEGWQFWQWEEQQPTADEVTAALARKSTGGKLGNHRRWHTGEGKSDPRCLYCRGDNDRSTDRSTESVPNRTEGRGEGSGRPGGDAKGNRSAGQPRRRTADKASRPDRPSSEAFSDRTTDRTTDRGSESDANPTDPTRPDPTRTSTSFGSTEGSVGAPEAPPAATKTKTRTRSATHIPDDFHVTDVLRTWATENAPLASIDAETEKFRDYWRAATRDAVKRDWDAAWRTWMRKAQQYAEERGVVRANGVRPYNSQPGTAVARREPTDRPRSVADDRVDDALGWAREFAERDGS
jgi:hypothetical protein